NAAFRGPRIIFGYYEGGLICELLIGRYGFPPVIRLLEAFDKGLDLDQALKTVYDLTPEELDFQLQKLVDVKLKDLYIEPRWSSNLLLRERLRLASKVPGDPAQRAEWQAAWCTQAWGSWQQGRQIDAEEALRQMRRAGEDSPRAKILLGNMAIQAGQPQRAIESWEEAFAAGAEDFHARIALGNLRLGLGETEEAEKQFLAAERAFPGFADADFAAELRLVSLYIDSDRRDDAMLAAERYVIFDAGSYQWRRRVAAWHAENERWERAAFLLHEANEIDPFSRKLHMEWATALEHLGQFEEALREYEVVAIVPVELDLDSGVPLSEPEVAALFGKRLNCLVELGRLDEAETLIEECADGGITSPEIDEASERLLEARG
ncbi:MAG: tetratricopeptide (TPR) repeat protein, partial [Planctomycetota bacterium]